MARRSALDREIGVRVPVPQLDVPKDAFGWLGRYSDQSDQIFSRSRTPTPAEILATLRRRMWRLRHVLVPVAAVAAGFALSACGGDSSPETPIAVPTDTQPTLDKTQFIAQADSVCAEANASIEQFAAAGQGLTEAEQIAQIREGVVEQVRQLDPPDQDRTTLDQFLKAVTDQVAAGQKIGLALQRGEDTAQFETELDNARSAAESAASTYGFEECGSPISSGPSPPSPGATADTGGAVTPSAPAAPVPSAPSGGTSGGSADTGGGSTGGGTGSGTPDSAGGTGGAPSGGIGPG
jgi:hypothetical protein